MKNLIKNPANFVFSLLNWYQFALPVVVCSFALLLASCSSGNNPTDGGSGSGSGNGEMAADTTFSSVQTIFNNNCGNSGCHINDRTNGVRLDSYDNVVNSVGDQYGQKVVMPNDPDNSPLMDKIANANPKFGARMPQGRAALSDDQIGLIRAWIADGAKNN